MDVGMWVGGGGGVAVVEVWRCGGGGGVAVVEVWRWWRCGGDGVAVEVWRWWYFYIYYLNHVLRKLLYLVFLYLFACA